MNVQTALRWATNRLKNSSSPALDAEVLLCHVLKKDKTYLYSNPKLELTKLQATNYKLLIAKRRNHWPVAYLTEHKEFFGLDFKVTPDVLIPRPETELLVELAIQAISDLPAGEAGKRLAIRNVIDVGTGSGNIIISLTKHISHNKIKFYATDLSSKALQIAPANAGRHKVKIRFVQADLIPKELDLNNSLILANLPYGWNEWKNNTSADTAGLKFEPKQALFTKELGLYHIRRLLELLHTFCHSVPRVGIHTKSLVPDQIRRDKIILLIEHDPRQKQKITQLAKKYFPGAKLKFHKDLARNYRVMQITT